MSIILTNVSSNKILINDLGIELESNEFIDLDEEFTDEEILESEDLEPIVNSGDVTIKINNQNSSYNVLVNYLRKLNIYQHNKIDSLVHNLSEQAFFEVEKDSNNRTQFTFFYTDSSKTKKIREEEVVRDTNGRVSTLIIRQYDDNGNLINTESQIINRDANGNFSNISYQTS